MPDPKDVPADPELVRLAKLVKLMRAAQKEFFAGDKSPAKVKLAKDLERRVDRAVSWVLANRSGVQAQAELPLGGTGGAPADLGTYRRKDF